MRHCLRAKFCPRGCTSWTKIADLGIIFLRRSYLIHWYQLLHARIVGSIPFRLFYGPPCIGFLPCLLAPRWDTDWWGWRGRRWCWSGCYGTGKRIRVLLIDFKLSWKREKRVRSLVILIRGIQKNSLIAGATLICFQIWQVTQQTPIKILSINSTLIALDGGGGGGLQM